jgi:uncharacterized protein YukE
MFGQLLVTLEAITGFLKEAEQAQDMLDGAIKKCDGAAKDLLANWKGDAANAFAAEEEQFNMWSIQMGGFAREAFSVIGKAVEIYRAAEDLING